MLFQAGSAKVAGMKKASANANIAAGTWRGALAELCLGRSWASAVAVVALLGAAVWVTWLQVRASVMLRTDYQLQLEDLELSPKPEWIRADLRAEALRGAALDPPLPLLQEHLATRLERAFALHPWVQSVTNIHLSYPAKAMIELVYREPVAMIEVPDGLLPIDAWGTLLPTADFTALDTKKYPRIVGADGAPFTPIGTVWNDSAVLAGAKIAKLLKDQWLRLDLARIRWTRDPQAANAWERYFVLETRSGTLLIWGEPPGRELNDEPLAKDKLAALAAWGAMSGGLETALLGGAVDLRKRETWPQSTALTEMK
jgi:hypothetical protein